MRKKILYRLGFSLLCALAITFSVSSGAIRRLDLWLEDFLFQQPRALSGDVRVIGIDEKALETLGPYNTWDRSIMASALEALNADPDHKPAVVAIDTLYSSETDPAIDQRLADAAKALDCVITASSAQFDERLLQNENGKYYFDSYYIVSYEEPYAALGDVTRQGHINAMYDSDGIMRHAMLYIEPDGQRVYSMAEQAAETFLEAQGRKLELPETDARGRFYVNYSAMPGDFYDGISIADLIAGNVPSDYYEGKIILIGPYAAGLQDDVLTPINRAKKMYGVEFQANVIEAYLAGEFKTELSDTAQMVLLFFISFIAMFLFLQSQLLFTSLTYLLVLVCSIVTSFLFYRSGTIMHPLWIPLGVGVLYLISIVLHYIRARLEKRKVTQTFERYVDPEIVNEILKEGTDSLGLQGKLCDIAVLFVDVRGFTTMSEKLDPETVVRILNKYLGMTSDVIHSHKGTLDKFVGDCTMAFWGAPLPQEDAVYNAVLSAMDIIKGAEEVSAHFEKEIGQTLHVGVGVNYGPAVVGNIGAESRMDFTAIGDTVNTAARLEANAPGGCVYISRSVADALGDRIRTTSLGSTIKLKGKAEGFEVLKVESILRPETQQTKTKK